MQSKKDRPATIDEYIAQFPEEVRRILQTIRTTIKESAPDASERISYQMPGFYLNGNLVWFAAHPDYIGFYPTGSGVEAFKKQLSKYESTKGSVHFPISEPMPYDLIRKMVKFRVAENLAKKRRSRA